MIFEQYFPLVVDQLVKIWKPKKISWDSYVFEGQVLTISTNIGQQMYVLNEKVRAVLSLAFQNFHTIFEELNNVYNHFQVNSKIEFSDKLDLFIFLKEWTWSWTKNINWIINKRNKKRSRRKSRKINQYWTRNIDSNENLFSRNGLSTIPERIIELWSRIFR